MKKLVAYNTLSVKRVVTIAILVFSINFLPPLNQILATGVFPTLVQLCEHVTWGLIQVVTILYGLLKLEEQPEEPESKEG